MLWNLKASPLIAVFSLYSGYALLTVHGCDRDEKLRDVPPAIAVSPEFQRVLHAPASGWQIYTCKADAQGKYSWALKAPEAELQGRHGQVIGQHFAGPTWKLTDGSEVTGRRLEQVDSPDRDSIPWLLLDVVNNSGKGALAQVTKIQRLQTHGGKPGPDACDEAHSGAETKSSYTAQYYFYAPAR